LKNHSSRLFTGIIFILGTAITQLSAQNYIWPTDASQIINSSFGEYRAGHFHAGLDFKTWGKDGYKIIASAAGRVYRIHTGVYGYGRVLYLRLDSGETLVYAHLAAFSSKLTPYVRDAQKRKGQYAVDVFLPASEARVNEGEVLGFTGSTGNVPPHLHFEIRNQQNQPVNPFNYGFTVEDHCFPEISAVAISPFSNNAHAGGDFIPRKYKVVKEGRGVFRLKESLKVWGKTGLSVSVFDRADGADNKFAPYSIRLIVDGEEIYQVKYDKFDFSRTAQVDVERDFWLKQNGYGRFTCLYKAPGNTLPFCKPLEPEAGMLICGELPAETGYSQAALFLAAGKHVFKIEAVDYNGNASILRGLLEALPLKEVHPSNALPDLRCAPAGSKLSLKTVFYNETIHFSAISQSGWNNPPILSLKTGPWQEEIIPLYLQDDQTFTGKYIYTAKNKGSLQAELKAWVSRRISRIVRDTLTIFPVNPDSGGRIVSSDGLISLNYPENAVRTTLLGTCSERMVRLADSLLYRVWDFKPQDIMLNRALTCTFETNRQFYNDKQGLYSLSANLKVHFIKSIQPENPLTAQVGQSGCFVVLADTIPPEVRIIFPAEGAKIFQTEPVIKFFLQDQRSGIGGEDAYEVWLNEKKMIVEYVPARNLAKVILLEPLVCDEYILLIKVTDRAGNETIVRRVFQII